MGRFLYAKGTPFLGFITPFLTVILNFSLYKQGKGTR